MKISVLTVCRNSEATIGYALESVFAQAHAEKDLVTVDGASTDGTLDIVRSFPSDGVTVISEPDRGLYGAMNNGLAVFSGEADGLEHADIVFGDLDLVASHRPRQIVRRWRTGPYVRGAFRRSWMPAHPTFYCRREVVEAVGTFDLRYRTAADSGYMLRSLELRDFKAAAIGRVLVDMQHGGRSSDGIGASIHHNLEALDSRRRRLGAGFIDYALFAKHLSKVGQLLGSA